MPVARQPAPPPPPEPTIGFRLGWLPQVAPPPPPTDPVPWFVRLWPPAALGQDVPAARIGLGWLPQSAPPPPTVTGPPGGTWTEFPRNLTWTEPPRNLTWRFPTVSVQTKRVAEVRLYLWNFASFPELRLGDTIASVTSILCTQASEGGTVTDLALSAKAVGLTLTTAQCVIAGGVDGVYYVLEFTVLTTAGWTLVGKGTLSVSD